MNCTVPRMAQPQQRIGRLDGISSQCRDGGGIRILPAASADPMRMDDVAARLIRPFLLDAFHVSRVAKRRQTKMRSRIREIGH